MRDWAERTKEPADWRKIQLKAEEINKMLRELGELSPDEAGSLDEHYQRFLRDQAFDAESERVYERKDPK